jgi:hypothetical protein
MPDIFKEKRKVENVTLGSQKVEWAQQIYEQALPSSLPRRSEGLAISTFYMRLL